MKIAIVLLLTLSITTQAQISDEQPQLKTQQSPKSQTTIDNQYVINCAQENCTCMTPLKWNTQKMYCQVDCPNIDLTTGKQINRYQCECIESAHWNLYYFKCYYDCSLFNKKIFSATYQMCVPDCNQIDFAYGPEYMTDKGVRCHCQTGYKWSWSWQSCNEYGSSYVEF